MRSRSNSAREAKQIESQPSVGGRGIDRIAETFKTHLPLKQVIPLEHSGDSGRMQVIVRKTIHGKADEKDGQAADYDVASNFGPIATPFQTGS